MDRLLLGSRLLLTCLCISLTGCSFVRLMGEPRGWAASPLLPGELQSTQAGTIADLDDGLFSEKNGKRGYWKPLEFHRQIGANIYFLEPYDPARVPILFVHGAAGSPRDWRYLAGHLDRSRYQAWFFYYPSGASVDSISHLLFWKLLNLQERHHPETIHLVAHSLGGLVVRSLLGQYQSRVPGVKLFISISTPWGGEELASLAPPGLPNWNDMRPEGALLSSLFERKLPLGIDYYLFFGYKGGRSLVRPLNDGTVTLKSELEMSAQAEAQRVYGFDENHTSILRSPTVAAVLNDLLRASEPRRAAGISPLSRDDGRGGSR